MSMLASIAHLARRREHTMMFCRVGSRSFRSRVVSRIPSHIPAMYHPPYGRQRWMSEFYAPLPSQTTAFKTVFEIISHGTVAELKVVMQMEGCDPNIRNEDLKTPLMIAAENGKCDMMAVLIENGARVNLQDVFGDTALMLAARQNCKDAVNLLLNVGAQPDIHNNEDMSAADATMDNEIDCNIRKTQDPGAEGTPWQ